jgi:hypothetical protein
MLRRVRFVLLLLLAAALATLIVWGGLVILFSPIVDESRRLPISAIWSLYGVGTLAAYTRRRWRGPAVMAALAAFGIVAFEWSMLVPSNERDWQRDLAVLPSATIAGDMVTIRNIRNIDYRSETDFDVRYYDKTFDLRELDSVDLVATYWMGPAVAHIMVSFGFGGQDFVAISIEARKERSEAYSTVKGFFRQYELIYVVADERDLLRLRTNYRKDPIEDVYLYRLTVEPEIARRVFLDYIRAINELARRPAWYNTATSNCTSNIWMHAAVNPERLSFSWKILVSGFAPEYLYEMKRMAADLSFADLQAKGLINGRARAADHAADFSRRIREGVPGWQ